MTTKELIEQLKQMPQEMEAYLYDKSTGLYREVKQEDVRVANVQVTDWNTDHDGGQVADYMRAIIIEIKQT